jgi:autotransporter-associated beta strand protein
MRSLIVSVASFFVVLVAVAVAVPRDAEAAAQREWVGMPNGTWSSASNWNGGTQIANGDFLTFGDGSNGGQTTNDIAGGSYQRITFEHSTGNGYVLQGNAITLEELTVAKDAFIHEIALNIGGTARTLVADGSTLVLSGTNTFSGDIDVVGTLEARTNEALGSIARSTNILPDGTLAISGRDLGMS